MLSLQLLGGCTLSGDGIPLSGAAVQRRRLALLALIASSRSTGISRDKLTACFWPDETSDHARHFLADSLFTIRRAIGKDVILTTGSDIRLNPLIIGSDVWAFSDAVAKRDFIAAVALYRGPFLDGFFVSDAPDFDRWADSEREQLAVQYGRCLKGIAQDYEARRDYGTAADWWKRLAAHDPYNARVALATMRALDLAGDAAAAVQHAAKYERLIHEDLELAPDAAVAALAAELRSGSRPLKEPRPVTHLSASSTPVMSASPGANPPPPDAASEQQAPLEDPRAAGKLRWRRRPALAAAIVAIVALAGTAMALGGFIRKGEMHAVPGAGSAVRNSAILSPGGTASKTARMEAEDLYHQARYLMHKTVNDARFPEAIALYQKAVIRDPGFGKAYAGMADTYSYMGEPARAKAHALEALRLDSTSAEAHNSLAYVYGYYEHRWLAADSAARRATSLDPGFILAHLRRAVINGALGRADTAFASLEKARELEPDSWTVLYNRGSVAAALGMTSEAIKYFEAALALEPGRHGLRRELSWQYFTAGRRVEAATLMRSVGSPNDAAIVAGDLPHLRSLIEQFERDTATLESCQAAMIYIVLGKKDAAFRQLRRGISENRLLPLQMRSAPYLWLKGDRQYDEVMTELGLQPG